MAFSGVFLLATGATTVNCGQDRPQEKFSSQSLFSSQLNPKDKSNKAPQREQF